MEKQNNGNLISRELAIERLKGVIARTGMYGVSIEVIMKALPSVEAEPVVHAHWIIERWGSGYIKGCDCSNCGNHPRDSYNLPKYCDNCGAHMDEEVADV